MFTQDQKNQISDAIGFEFNEGELQAVNASDLLAVFQLGIGAYINADPKKEMGDIATVLLANALTENYLELHYALTIDYSERQLPDMIVTVQLKSGATPHEKRLEAEAELQQYKDMYHRSSAESIAEAHKCFALQLQCGKLTEQLILLSDALKPFADYRRVNGKGIYLAVGGGCGHAEVDHDNWTNALNAYSAVMAIDTLDNKEIV